ncbi:hypothetical protein WR25_14929 [Diploscapter pachys]|uniref:G-protein coupled receptors family 1 profile domain-containing protein n=1 Tax=Diploscapter pachys TaxID=2018661 RepID=A0A2A2LS32_9BILA|nr:hypothetical protein WR25_14929 [Diploscapter pachys]
MNSSAVPTNGTESGVKMINMVAYFYVLPIIAMIGIIGNVTNLVVLASSRLRAVSYMYLRALAVADLICMIATIGFILTERLQASRSPIVNYGIYQIYQCHFMLTLINWALGAGVYVVIMIAFRKRQKMFQQLTKRREQGSSSKDETLLIMLGGTVVMSLVCNIPAAVNLIIIDEVLKQRIDFQIFRATANLLEILNHASQFYVLCACSTDYRITFLAKFPCFKKHLSHRDRLRSFVRRTQSLVTTKDRGSNEGTQTHSSPKGSKTAESRLVAEGEGEGQMFEDNSSLEEEEDTLLKYGAIAKLITSDSNKSTFL